MKRVIVIVLGDLGRSPRILNQALSFSNLGDFHVDLIGYKGASLPRKINEKQNININYINSAPKLPSDLPNYIYLMYVPFKALYLLISLFFLLIWLPSADFILVQNPPAIPTLLVVQIISFLKRSKLIIDWHNFGYSILALRFGFQHFIVKLAHLYEYTIGRNAFLHITVTEAMKRELINVWKVRGDVIVLHDKASKEFKRLELDDIHKLMIDLESTQQEFILLKDSFTNSIDENSTLLTQYNNIKKSIENKLDKPYLLVSSTSWTPDEDFSILLKALELYDEQAQDNPNKYGKLAVVITGKGPDKEYYEKQIQQLNKKFQSVKIITSWLPINLYPKLLGAADLGISLHTSSSGLDLPMKVVDMFGANLPVCAMDFNCLDELVVHNFNGLVFNSSEELANHLTYLFDLNDKPEDKLNTLRKGVKEFIGVRWEKHWNDKMVPIVGDGK